MCKFIGFVLIFCLLIRNTSQVSLEEDLTISNKEKEILENFKERIEGRLPHDYMRKDIYLIRWLRARNFDLVAAEQMLLKNLDWRETNKIDDILNEDFSDIEPEFKIYINTYQLNGTTGIIVFANVGNWDIRKGVIQGKTQRGLRFLDKHLEEVTTKIRQLQNEGHNITQYNFVFDMSQFSIVQHACLQCVAALTSYIISYENHYPAAANAMLFVNTPTAFEILLNAVKNALSPITRKTIQFYGTNKAQWQPIVFGIIPREYLPTDVGGFKELDD